MLFTFVCGPGQRGNGMGCSYNRLCIDRTPYASRVISDVCGGLWTLHVRKRGAFLLPVTILMNLKTFRPVHYFSAQF